MVKSRVGQSVDALKKEAREKASKYERQYHGCSQATLLAFQEVMGLEDQMVLKAATALCGGAALTGQTCGALTGGIMALGMKYGRSNLEEGIGSVLRACLPAHKLVTWFEREFGTCRCHEISGFGMDEETLKGAIANPEAVEANLDPALIEKCSDLCGRTAEKLVEIVCETEV